MQESIQESMPLWLSLSLDPVEQQVTILGLGFKKSISKHYKRAGDSLYRNSFYLCDEVGNEIAKWLKSCGVPRSEIGFLVREIGFTMYQFIEDNTKD